MDFDAYLFSTSPTKGFAHPLVFKIKCGPLSTQVRGNKSRNYCASKPPVKPQTQPLSTFPPLSYAT